MRWPPTHFKYVIGEEGGDEKEIGSEERASRVSLCDVRAAHDGRTAVGVDIDNNLIRRAAAFAKIRCTFPLMLE